ncbi:MAG: orotidine-5'-phosphate decarboxylase [Actinomycetota bacterium]
MNSSAVAAPLAVRSRLAVALDVPDGREALELARELQPWFGVAKVGLELFSAAGPDVVGELTDLGYDVFCDLKFHDIPTTVGRAARVIGSLGATYLNLHAQGGGPMLAAGVEGFLDGARQAGTPAPVALAVTILTSEADAPADVLERRVRLAMDAGCGGIVCAASDVVAAKRIGPRLVTVVPGIRPEGSPVHDQARAATPTDAIAAGADLLVIGRSVTHAPDRADAAARIAASIAR